MLRRLGVAVAVGLVRGALIGIDRAVNQSGKPAKSRNRFPGKRPGERARVKIIRRDVKK